MYRTFLQSDFGGHDNVHHDNLYAYGTLVPAVGRCPALQQVSLCVVVCAVGGGFSIVDQLVGHVDMFFNNTLLMNSDGPYGMATNMMFLYVLVPVCCRCHPIRTAANPQCLSCFKYWYPFYLCTESVLLQSHGLLFITVYFPSRLVPCMGDYSINIFQSSVCACAQRTGGPTSPAPHACGSASPLSACCCHRKNGRN